MKNVSIWEATCGEEAVFPTLQGDKTADVVIIGAGITGLTAAQLLAEAGRKVVVLEAMRTGMGTTGHSTGNLYCTVDEHLHTIRKKWGADTMKAVVQSRTAAIDQIEANVRQYNISCDFYRTSFHFYAEQPDPDIEEFISKEQEAYLEAGLPATISNTADLPFEVKKALIVAGQAQFHPLAYARGLAKSISAQCSIYENSPVTDLDDDTGLVSTPAGTVKAEHIIMATHTPKGIYMVHTLMGAYREHGVAALHTGPFVPGIFWSLGKPKHSIRWLQSGDQNYVMVVGDKYKTGHGENTFDYISRLDQYLDERFSLEGARYYWGGQHYRSADGLPYIGKRGKRLFMLTGFATDGLVYGTLGARIVSDMILGRENAWEAVYRLQRFTPIKSFSEFFKVSADTLAQYIKDTPWNADNDNLKGMKPGEARIIEQSGEKYAVYRDDGGVFHVLSAACTHMKCVVSWNPAEKTWDCPCHGSRFSIDGKVLEGPATNELPTITT